MTTTTSAQRERWYVLALFYVTIGIPIASLADRANRRNIFAIAPTGFWAAWHLYRSGATIQENELRARAGGLLSEPLQ